MLILALEGIAKQGSNHMTPKIHSFYHLSYKKTVVYTLSMLY